MEPKVEDWTKADLKEFDRLITLCDSPRQIQRIDGRLKWTEFEKRFTKEQLADMWQFIKDKK